jgi:hypothetical protein
MGRMQTVLKKSRVAINMAAWLFYWGKKMVEMKNIEPTIAWSCFSRTFFSVFILFVTSPSWAGGLCAENVTSSANEPAKTISNEEAVNIAKAYLNIENTVNYKIKIEEKVITADTFNTYKILEPGINRLCWVVTLIVPDAVGAGRTVFVDKENGEILGGYSSK